LAKRSKNKNNKTPKGTKITQGLTPDIKNPIEKNSKFYIKKFFVSLSVLGNVFLIFLTLLSWLPSIRVKPDLMYLDGRQNSFPLIIENDSFIPIYEVSSFIDFKTLDVKCKPEGGAVIQGYEDRLFSAREELKDNYPFTIYLNASIGVINPIDDVNNSDFEINIYYRIPIINYLPFFPDYFSEQFKFKAAKNDDYSIKWNPR
jgi:hypothetical protein